MRFISVLLLCVAALRAEAMARVVAIEDGRTITIERNGVRERVRLGGLTIIDDTRAREVLRWTALDTWVMLEAAAPGEFLVYRSPDALLVNRELVLRGFARATLASVDVQLRAPSRYLGEIDPPADSRQPRQRAAPAKPSETRTGSGTSRRSKASPSRPARKSGRGRGSR